MLDRFSTFVQPDCKYKTNHANLDGSGVDVHSLIGKLLHPNAKKDGSFLDTTTLDPTTLLTISSNTIQKQAT